MLFKSFSKCICVKPQDIQHNFSRKNKTKRYPFTFCKFVCIASCNYPVMPWLRSRITFYPGKIDGSRGILEKLRLVIKKFLDSGSCRKGKQNKIYSSQLKTKGKYLSREISNSSCTDKSSQKTRTSFIDCLISLRSHCLALSYLGQTRKCDGSLNRAR